MPTCFGIGRPVFGHLLHFEFKTIAAFQQYSSSDAISFHFKSNVSCFTWNAEILQEEQERERNLKSFLFL